MSIRRAKRIKTRNKISNKKIIITTILATIWVESVVLWFLFFLFYTNYEKLSLSESWESKKINFDYKEIKDNSKNKIIYKNKDILYSWTLWELKYVKKVIARDENDKKIYFKLNENYVKNLLFLNILAKENLIDKNILDYFLNLDKNKDFTLEFESFMNFLVLLNKIDEQKAKKIILNYQTVFDKVKKNLETYKKKWNYDILADKLKNTEVSLDKSISKISKNIPDKIYNNQDFFKNENVIFVISKLYDKKYYNNIEKIAEIYDIDEKKIISSIAVEQLRYLSTQRWYAKYLIQSSPYLTTFSKFSYWLWWVKVETAREIQESVKKYNKEIYEKYFAKDSMKTDEELIEVLKDDFWWFLYTGWLIFSIEQRWKTAGFDISNKPWVVTTLYNMWNPDDKIPNSSPKIGGSLIAVNWKDMYFWEIWFLYYYYINYYIA